MSKSTELATVELNDAAEPVAVPPKWFVSPSASGGSDEANDGRSATSPFATIGKAIRGATPGDVILVRAGTYEESIELKPGSAREGTLEAPITLLGEGMPKLLARAPHTLVRVRLPHWRIEGFELDMNGLGAQAVSFKGNTQGSSLARCNVHDGKLGAAISTSEGAHGVTIEENDIHDFFHAEKDKDSHGVVVQPTSRDITIRRNRISATSGDAVQVTFGEEHKGMQPAELVRIEDNELKRTRENAVDIKTSRHVTVRGNIMEDFRNTATSGGDGVVIHYSAEDVTIEGNVIALAGRGISVGGIKEKGMPDPQDIRLLNNIIRDISIERAKVNGDGSKDAVGIRVNNAQNVEIRGNIIERTGFYAVRIGSGEGASREVAVADNTLRTDLLVRLGSARSGLQMSRNHYGPGLLDAGGNRKTRKLAEWQRLTGLDVDSDQED